MRKHLKKYIPFFKAGVQEGVFYKINFAFLVGGNILSAFIMYFLWKAVFSSSNTSSLNGFDLQNMTQYIFVAFFTATIITSNKSREISEEIRDGSISLKLLKPLNFSLLYLFTELGSKFVEVCLLIGPVFGGLKIFSIYTIGVANFGWANFVMYSISLAFAYLINFYFNICFSFFAFVFNNLWGTNLLKNCIVGLLSGALVPISFLPGILKDVAMFLPFASLNYTPVMILLGQYGTNKLISLIVVQLFWLFFFIILSHVIWNKVIGYISIQGG